MPLFTRIGDTHPPACKCEEARGLCQYIEGYLRTAPQTRADDYTLHTGKNDASVEEASMYALRDAIQWVTFWHGHGAFQHRWKVLYIALTTIPDDILIPPQDLINGSVRLLGHSLADILTGLATEGVHPNDIKYAKMCMWRQYIMQYLEKVDLLLRGKLTQNINLMALFRAYTGNSHGGAIVMMAARGARSRGVSDVTIDMAAMATVLSLDLAKESVGILKGEATETTAGDREQRHRELRWIYARYVEQLNLQRNAHFLKRYATSSLFTVPLMDRYQERTSGLRFPISPALQSAIDFFRAQKD